MTSHYGVDWCYKSNHRANVVVCDDFPFLAHQTTHPATFLQRSFASFLPSSAAASASHPLPFVPSTIPAPRNYVKSFPYHRLLFRDQRDASFLLMNVARTQTHPRKTTILSLGSLVFKLSGYFQVFTPEQDLGDKQ
jgi:hypothetical protein